MGGSYGALEGIKKSPSTTFKIRFNSMLNYSAKRGSTLGNMLGVLGMLEILFLIFSHYVRLFREGGRKGTSR